MKKSKVKPGLYVHCRICNHTRYLTVEYLRYCLERFDEAKKGGGSMVIHLDKPPEFDLPNYPTTLVSY